MRLLRESESKDVRRELDGSSGLVARGLRSGCTGGVLKSRVIMGRVGADDQPEPKGRGVDVEDC